MAKIPIALAAVFALLAGASFAESDDATRASKEAPSTPGDTLNSPVDDPI